MNGAAVSIHRTVVDGWAHEGVAASGPAAMASSVLVAESLVRRCGGAGVEAGYGAPEVREATGKAKKKKKKKKKQAAPPVSGGGAAASSPGHRRRSFSTDAA